MNHRRHVLAAFALAFFGLGQAHAQPLTTALTYQGELRSGGTPVGGPVDLRFRLYSALVGGAQIGPELSALNLTPSDGRFTATLDFGSAALDGQRRWLEIDVRPAGGGAYTTLAPRQELTVAPHAAVALSAKSAPWSGLSGVPAGFADGADDGFTIAGQGLQGSGQSVFLDLAFTDNRYFQPTVQSLAGDVFGYVGNVTVSRLLTRPLALSAQNPANNDVLTWDVNQGGWAPKPTQHWSPGQGMQQITGSYAVDFAVLDARYMGQNPILGGDLSGLANAASVNALRGRSVSGAAPSLNQVLKWNGSEWAPAGDAGTVFSAGSGLQLVGGVLSLNFSTLSGQYVDESQSAGGDASGTFGALQITGLRTRPVSSAAPALNDVLKWNGAQWAPATDANSLYTAGAGLTLSAGAFSIAVGGVTPLMLASDSAGLAKVTNSAMSVSSGNVGVGAGTPTSQLHVFGNLAVTGSVLLTPQSRTWSAPFSAWAPGFGTPTDINYVSNGIVGQSLFVNYTLEMPLNLPQGATVSALAFWALDNNGNDITFSLVRIPHDGSALASTVLSSSGSAGGVRTFTVPANVPIDNTTGAYRLRASWNTGSSAGTLRMHGVAITYQVSAPLP
ncbi:MAG: hypothetical protein KIT68_10670 [Phycisphaeraceae bacterium]|nr:hypothetical protein [Phycisphaeraceae bacterium]